MSLLDEAGGAAADRLRIAKFLRSSMKKIFPDHWSFLLGEIALYSFILLLLSGTFLTFWFEPSLTQITYHGTPPEHAAMTPTTPGPDGQFRWLMASDVCKHCTHAACLDVCPTGSLFRTEFGTVVVQEDICNGCGYCIPACPYGVIDQRQGDGRAWKCTLCYDRLGDGLEPACAKACPTNSIQFGPLDELRARAARRLAQLREAGVADARLYGEDPGDGVGGDGAFFLLLDEPEVYGLPPDPVVTTRDLPSMWRHVGAAAATLAAVAAASFAATLLGRKR